MKKILILLLVASFVLVGCLPKPLTNQNTNQPVLDEVSQLLTNLKTATGINFSAIQPTEFKWVIAVDPKVEEITIQGQGFEAKEISSQQYQAIADWLKEQGFRINLHNIAAGTISGLEGYQKDQTVCTVAGGATGYKEATGQWIPPETDKKDVEVKCSQREWQSYQNEKYGYSLKYPANCLYGPLPGYCKQKSWEERSAECLCHFNGEDPNSVSMQTFTGEKDNLNGASFVVFHSIFVDRYSPPAGTDIIAWLKENFSYQDIPDEINMEIDGIPAVKVYTPQSPMAYSQEDIYFLKNNKLLRITLLDVDNQDNRKLYDQILATFKLEESCVKKETGESLSLTEAKQIAIASECENRLKENAFCNEDTGTWWIDLDIEKEMCNPACVIKVDTKEAEINWRCTGLIE